MPPRRQHPRSIEEGQQSERGHEKINTTSRGNDIADNDTASKLHRRRIPTKRALQAIAVAAVTLATTATIAFVDTVLPAFIHSDDATLLWRTASSIAAASVAVSAPGDVDGILRTNFEWEAGEGKVAADHQPYSSPPAVTATAVIGTTGHRRSLPTLGLIEDAERESYERCWQDKSGRHRCQANVFFFGVSKCGTTSLSSWMTQHPTLRWVWSDGMLGRAGLEAHALDALSDEKFETMLLHGPDGKYEAAAPEASVEDRVIDYTPHYSILAKVPFRILDMYGQASFDGSHKYIVALREPASRVISSWEYKFKLPDQREELIRKKKAFESRTLVEAVREGREAVVALLQCREDLGRATSFPWDRQNLHLLELDICNPRYFLGGSVYDLYLAHVGKSMYALQLERWFTLFGRGNIKVIFLEEMAEDPVATLEGVFDFLGMDFVDPDGIKGLPSREDWSRITATHQNVTDRRKKSALADQVTPGVVEDLRKFFAPHNSRLEELIGRPVPDAWSTS